jgi:hypothetical protein
VSSSSGPFVSPLLISLRWTADYFASTSGRCSLRYHRLHPEYIHQRIERLGQSYNLRILLLMCDIVRPPPPMHGPAPHPSSSVRTPRAHPRAHEGLPPQQHHSHRSLVVSPTPPFLPSPLCRPPNAHTHTHIANPRRATAQTKQASTSPPTNSPSTAHPRSSASASTKRPTRSSARRSRASRA